MIEIFSSDIEYVCKHMQETLDGPNGVLVDALTQESNELQEYKVLQKYKYDDGNPFAILSRRYYRGDGRLYFYVMLDVEWYKKATKSQFNLISTLALNIKNLQLNAPIFMYSYTFSNGISGTGSYTLKKGLKVIYTDCVIGGSEELYNTSNYNVFNGCVFNEK